VGVFRYILRKEGSPEGRPLSFYRQEPMTIRRSLILLALIFLSTSVHAQRFNQNKIRDGLRNGNWEAGLLLQYQNSFGDEFENGAAIDIDSSMGFGFKVGWNWTQKWNLSYRFSLNKPDYTAIIVPEDPELPNQTLDYQMSKYSHQFNVTYHFLKGPLTPFVQAGIGWTKLDSNVPDSPPSVGCWWDPWWGYICFSDWSTYSTSKFTYNVGLGLRWDVNGALFLSGSWNRQFISVKNGNMDLDTINMEAGFMW
jgi:opacity protein-like surface antigen